MTQNDRSINFARENNTNQVLWSSVDLKVWRQFTGFSAECYRYCLPQVRKVLCPKTAFAKRNAYKLAQLTQTDNRRTIFGAFPQIEVKINFVRKPIVSWGQRALNWFANGAIALALITTVTYFGPKLATQIFSSSQEQDLEAKAAYLLDQELLPIEQTWEETLVTTQTLPEFDTTLPSEDWLRIPFLGVDTPLLTNTNSTNIKEVNALLDKGVYIYPEFSEIGGKTQPVLLAGHHYNMASNAYRDQHTFQNLNELIPGDVIELIAEQRKWIYEVYLIDDNTQIVDEEADLIMYTCINWWDSERRLFVYGRLIDPQLYNNVEVKSETTALGALLN